MMADLIIIGGGPAGYQAAECALKRGMSVILFEKRALGGVCLNEGCIPTKTLLYSAKLLDYAKNTKYGVYCDNVRIDYPAALARKNKVVKTLTAGIAARLKGVEIVKREAVVTDKNAEGFEVEAGERRYRAPRLLVATGSQPVIPPIDGLREALERGVALTSREVLDLSDVPARLAVVGGGVIGLETASLFSSLGSRVTVIERLDEIGGQTEREIAGILRKNYAKKGVVFELGAKVTRIALGENSAEVTFEQAGVTKHSENEKVLIAAGRKPVLNGLEKLGLAVEHGAVVTDESLRTSVEGVYAAGDVNGRSMLAHTAYRESEVAVDAMCGGTGKMDYSAVPYVIYTNPEVAGVGETLSSAREKGVEAREKVLSMRYSGRYLAENEGGDGICKTVTDPGGRLLGVHIIANPASEIITSAAMALGKSAEELEKIIFPHPSVGEILKDCFKISL